MIDGASHSPNSGPADPPKLADSCETLASQPIVAASLSWNCKCLMACTSAQAAQCLYLHALDVLSDTTNATGRDAIQRLIGPLITLVGQQKTRQGQKECSAFVSALLEGDEGSAMLACRRLIEMAESQKEAK